MRILLLNQCFYPDVVSTAQHASDLAAALSARAHNVTVIAGTRAYDNPATRFPRTEWWQGCRILRVPSLALGKTAKWRRAANFASFFFSALVRLLFLPRVDVVMALTSPPLISALGALFVKIKGGRFVFWVMDLNPDEAIAAGWLHKDSRTAKILEAFLDFSLRAAAEIIVLDRFMRDRIIAKGLPPDRISTIPPWAHSEVVQHDVAGRRDFRARYGLSDKYVVMYSGNHSPCHPLHTLLEAARRLSSSTAIVFCFIGGGSEFPAVQAFARTHNLRNILCLPYQPLTGLSASLSAADLHIVVMGAPLVGIVHTCKIYNIMCVGSPVLYIGPSSSHVMDIAAGNGIPLSAVSHGDVDAVIRRIVSGVQANVPHPGMLARGRHFHQLQLVPRMVNLVERLEQAATSTVQSEPEPEQELVTTADSGPVRGFSLGD
jgi:colanic acid biosynthesis glycosyl transferase WcaI